MEKDSWAVAAEKELVHKTDVMSVMRTHCVFSQHDMMQAKMKLNVNTVTNSMERSLTGSAQRSVCLAGEQEVMSCAAGIQYLGCWNKVKLVVIHECNSVCSF